MSENTMSRRSVMLIAALAAVVFTVVYASVAMAAGGSSSSGSSAPSGAYSGHSMFAASGGQNGQGDCPNMGGNGNGGSQSQTTPSTQDSSFNPSL